MGKGGERERVNVRRESQYKLIMLVFSHHPMEIHSLEVLSGLPYWDEAVNRTAIHEHFHPLALSRHLVFSATFQLLSSGLLSIPVSCCMNRFAFRETVVARCARGCGGSVFCGWDRTA